MIKLDIFGKTFIFRFGFFTVIAIFCLLDAPELAAVSACSCTVHELGHLFGAVLFEVRVKTVTFWAGGVKMITERNLRPLSYDIIILLAGPLFNFISAVYMQFTGNTPALAVNLFLGIFNLLPFSELDGGSVLRLFFEHKMINPDIFMKITAAVFSLFLFLYLFISGNGNITSYLTLLILLVSELAERK